MKSLVAFAESFFQANKKRFGANYGEGHKTHKEKYCRVLCDCVNLVNLMANLPFHKRILQLAKDKKVRSIFGSRKIVGSR